ELHAVRIRRRQATTDLANGLMVEPPIPAHRDLRIRRRAESFQRARELRRRRSGDGNRERRRSSANGQVAHRSYRARSVMVSLTEPAIGVSAFKVTVEPAAPTTSHDNSVDPPLPVIASMSCMPR